MKLFNDSFPIYHYIKKRPIFKKNIKYFIEFLKYLIKVTIVQKIPNILGTIIDFLPVQFIQKRYVFVRANCDHFGPWIWLYLFCLTQNQNSSKKVFCLATEGTISDDWINFLKFDNLHLIYNPLFTYIISPFFFSTKLALDVNAQIPLQYFIQGKNYRNFKIIDYLTENILEKIKLPIINMQNNNQTYNQLQNRPYVLLYARSGYWEHSIKKSKRNMPINIFLEIINFVGTTHNIFLIGDCHKLINLKKDFLFSCESFNNENINLPYIYKNAESVIGSASGATHFPSLIFNKPSLFICDIPIVHILTAYSFQKDWKEKIIEKNFIIPKKDYWLMVSNIILETKGFSSIKQTLNSFLQKKCIQEELIDRDNFYDFSEKKCKKYKTKNPSDNSYGKILIHNNYNYEILKDIP